MDCAYKSDRGANVFFNVNSKILDSNTFSQQSSASQTSSQKSVTNLSEDCVSILSNGTCNNVKTVPENNVYPEVLHSKQILLTETDTNADVVDTTGPPKTFSSDCSIHLQQLGEPIEQNNLSCVSKKKPISNEVEKLLNSSFSSQESENIVIDEAFCSDGDGKIESVSDLAHEEELNSRDCAGDICLQEDKTSHTNSRKAESVLTKDCESLVSKETAQKVGSFISTLGSTSEEEVFTEVDEIIDTDQNSVEGSQDGNESIVNEQNDDNVNVDSTELVVEGISESNLQLNQYKTIEDCNEILSEEEVYEEVEEDIDDEDLLDSDINNRKLSDDGVNDNALNEQLDNFIASKSDESKVNTNKGIEVSEINDKDLNEVSKNDIISENVELVVKVINEVSKNCIFSENAESEVNDREPNKVSKSLSENAELEVRNKSIARISENFVNEIVKSELNDKHFNEVPKNCIDIGNVESGMTKKENIEISKDCVFRKNAESEVNTNTNDLGEVVDDKDSNKVSPTHVNENTDFKVINKDHLNQGVDDCNEISRAHVMSENTESKVNDKDLLSKGVDDKDPNEVSMTHVSENTESKVNDEDLLNERLNDKDPNKVSKIGDFRENSECKLNDILEKGLNDKDCNEISKYGVITDAESKVNDKDLEGVSKICAVESLTSETISAEKGFLAVLSTDAEISDIECKNEHNSDITVKNISLNENDKKKNISLNEHEDNLIKTVSLNENEDSLLKPASLNEGKDGFIKSEEYSLNKVLAVTEDKISNKSLDFCEDDNTSTESPGLRDDLITEVADVRNVFSDLNSSDRNKMDDSCSNLTDTNHEVKSNVIVNSVSLTLDGKVDACTIISNDDYNTVIPSNHVQNLNKEVDIDLNEKEENKTGLANSKPTVVAAIVESKCDETTEHKDESQDFDVGLKETKSSDSELIILDEVGDSDDEDKNSTMSDLKQEAIALKDNAEKEKENNTSSPDVEGKHLDGGKLENSKDSSEGDDFDLDDAIKEFAMEEKSKVVKLSDELDSLVEEFVEAECSKEKEDKIKTKVTAMLPDSDDELELLIENFKASDSDDDCFIVDDNEKNIVIDVESKKNSRKRKKCINTQIIDLECEEKNQSLDAKPPEGKDALDKNINSPKSFEVDATVAVKVSLGSEDSTGRFSSGQKRKFSEIDCDDSQISTNFNSKKILNDNPNTESKSITNTEAEIKIPNSDAVSKEKHELSSSVDVKSVDCKMKVTDESVTNTSDLNFSSDIGKSAVSDTLSASAERKNKSCNINKNPNLCDTIKTTATGDNQGESALSVNFLVSEDAEDSVDMDEIIIDLPSKKDIVSSKEDEESKKRKINQVDCSASDVIVKKLKEDNVLDETHLSDGIALDGEAVETKVKENVQELVPKKESCKFETKKKCLDKIAMHLCTKTVQKIYAKECIQRKDTIKELEQKIQTLDEELLLFQSKASDLVSAQQEAFQEHGFNPQVLTRTVGVNVKIFRECDLQPIPGVNKPVPPPVAVTSSKLKSILLPAKESPPVPPVQQPKPPPVPSAAVSKKGMIPAIPPNITRPMVTAAQNVRQMSPNVTMSGMPLVTALGSNTSNPRPFTPRPAVASPRAPVVKDGKQLIDLTDESNARKAMPVAPNVVSVPPPTIPKVNLPGLANSQNVLVPIGNFFQMLPPGPQNNNQLSIGNPLQVSRQTLVPQGLLGPRTVAYIVPSNNGHINTIGGRGGLPLQPFLPGTNQRVQTIVVARVTNPGTVQPQNNMVNTSARLQVPQQQSLLSTTRTVPSTVPPVPNASGLVLFPRAAKHPAPFPPVPSYPLSAKAKALPPKPSLKGSRAPHGIILSWNMNLHPNHAEVCNYQLFAYQETSGPVSSSLWKKVGDVKALPLPMACTLTQFVEGNRYYFTVRAVDIYKRYGAYSDAVSIMYSHNKAPSK